MWRVFGLLASMVAVESSGAQARRSPPPTGAPRSPAGTVAPVPAHNAGVRLAATDLYDLYEYRMNQGWCVDGFAAVVVLFKVDSSYDVVVDDAYRARFEREIVPVVRAQCEPLRRISVFNHVKGFILSGAEVYTYEQAGSVTRENPLSSFIVTLDANGSPRFPADPGGVRSIAAAMERAGRNRAAQAEYTAARANEREEAARAESRLAATTRTDDGLLRLGGFSNDHKQLLLQIYDGKFTELARVDQPHYRPFQVYTALLQAYGDKCRRHLVDPVPVRFYGDQRVRTEVGPFGQTDYYGSRLLGTVYVERALEMPYRTAGRSHLTRMMDYWKRNMAGESILAFYTSESLKGIALAQAAHELVDNNGCTSEGLRKFVTTLTTYVSDAWSPAVADGRYQYSEETRPGDVVRRYEKVPADFRPPFPVMTTMPIVLLLNESANGDGLRMVQVKLFSHAPLAAKDRVDRISAMTPAVRAAIAERKYQVAECTYLAGGGSTTDFYWNANAPLPSEDVRAFFEGVIGAPRTSCPAASSRQ